MDASPRFKKAKDFARDFEALQECGLVHYEDDKCTIPDATAWNDFGYLVFLLWVQSQSSARQNSQFYMYRLSDGRTLLTLEPVSTAHSTITRGDLLSDAPYSKMADWCQMSITLKLNWLSSNDLPQPTEDEKGLLDCEDGECTGHRERLREWLENRIQDEPSFAQLMGACGESVVLNIDYSSLERLFGGDADSAPNYYERWWNAFAAISIASKLPVRCCECGTELDKPFRSSELDCVVWNDDPSFLVVVETTTKPSPSQRSEDLHGQQKVRKQAIKRLCADLLGTDVDSVKIEEAWKLKQKTLVAVALSTLKVDFFTYVYMQLAPQEKKLSEMLQAAFDDHPNHQFWPWLDKRKEAYHELMKGHFPATDLRAAFDDFVERLNVLATSVLDAFKQPGAEV